MSWKETKEEVLTESKTMSLIVLGALSLIVLGALGTGPEDMSSGSRGSIGRPQIGWEENGGLVILAAGTTLKNIFN